MIKHIVFFRMKETALGGTGAENAAALVNLLHALPAHIPQILALETGHDCNRSPAAWDLALYTEFQTLADLQTYQDHPEHRKVRDFVIATTADRAVVDYEV